MPPAMHEYDDQYRGQHHGSGAGNAVEAGDLDDDAQASQLELEIRNKKDDAGQGNG